MVLRKPYAFLIKHFRLIHLIITTLLVFLLIKNREVYIFLQECIGDSVNRFDALQYIDYGIYIYILILCGLFLVVYLLLKYKDKPRNIYVFSIVGYIIVGIFMFVLYSYLSTFINEAINQKTIRLYRDILSITILFQYYIILVMFIRGLGFDIKKFNFSKDAQELNATVEDGEEIEVNVGLDSTNVMREFRKQRREFGYFLKEFKLYIIIIVIILVSFFGYKGYNYLNDKLKIYNQNEWVGVNNYLSITDSYYNVNNGENYLIIKFDIYKLGRQKMFNTANINLLIDDKNYSVNKNVCYKFSSLGNCYKKQYIDNEVESYILTYSVDDINTEKSYIVYSDSYDKNFKIKLDLKNYEG